MKIRTPQIRCFVRTDGNRGPGTQVHGFPGGTSPLATMLAALAIVVTGAMAQAAPPPAPPPSSMHRISRTVLKPPQPPASSASDRSSPVLRAKQPATTLHAVGATRFELKHTIASPAQLAVIHDAKICTMRAGSSPQGPSCATLNDGGNVAMLSWVWAPCTHANCVKNISGYRIYHPGTPVYAALPGHAGGHRTGLTMNGKLVATVPPAQMAYGLATFKPGDCFVVRAYTNGLNGQPAQESADSDKFCLQRGMRIGTRSIALAPKYARNTSGSNDKPDQALGCPGRDHFVIDPDSSILPIDGNDTLPSELVVGNHQRLALSALHDEYACDHRLVTYHRAAVYFDLAGLSPPLVAATLTFDLHQSALRLGANGSEQEGSLHTYLFSCVAAIGYATDNWIDGWDQKAINGKGFIPQPSYRQRVNTPLRTDVHAIVAGWLAGSAPNRGFLLKMADSDEHEQSQNSVCLAAYDHFKLTVIVPRTL